MQNTVRTTIRIRKDLLDQSRLLALEKGSTLQDVINQTLAVGYRYITDLNPAQSAMSRIDHFREEVRKKGIKVNVNKLLEADKLDKK